MFFYCSKGHKNGAINAEKPKFCCSCGEKMGLEIKQNSIVANTNNNLIKNIPAQIITDEDNHNEESVFDIPDINGLSFEIETDVDYKKDIKSSFSLKDVAFTKAGQEINTPNNKISKKQSKALFKQIKDRARSKTETKTI